MRQRPGFVLNLLANMEDGVDWSLHHLSVDHEKRVTGSLLGILKFRVGIQQSCK